LVTPLLASPKGSNVHGGCPKLSRGQRCPEAVYKDCPERRPFGAGQSQNREEERSYPKGNKKRQWGEKGRKRKKKGPRINIKMATMWPM